MIINTDFLLNQIYPVGSLYITTNETNPSNFLGGTWEKITSDAYLKIVSSNAGNLGGTSSDHKIPVSSMPSHTHDMNDSTYGNQLNKMGVRGDGGGGSHSIPSYTQTNGFSVYKPTYTGGGQAYYPYYYGIYVFRRTA